MTCGKCKDSLEKRLDGRGNITNRISNFAVGSLFSAGGAIAGCKIAFYGILNNDIKSIYLGTALVAGGTFATVYCFNKIEKGFKKLKSYY